MRKYLLVALMFVVCTASATIPNNYYNAVNGKTIFDRKIFWIINNIKK